MSSYKFKKKSFFLQKDQADCGVVCLQNILHFYGAVVSLERLREMSGTSSSGTTLLGLSQAANELGLAARGATANSLEDVKRLDHPAILFTRVGNLPHFQIFYGWTGTHFLIGDPAKGREEVTEEKLNAIWVEKVILLVDPTDGLRKINDSHKSRTRWLLRIAKNYTTPLLITAVMGVLVSGLSLCTTIFSQQLVDKLLSNPNKERLYVSIGLLGGLLFFRSLLSYVRGHILARQAKNFNIDITTEFYRKLIQMPKRFFDTRKTGDMVARLNDTNRIQQTASMLIGEVSIQFLFAIICVVLLFSYSWIAGSIGVLVIPAILVLVLYFLPELVEGQRRVMVANAQNESNYIDNINAIGVIKLFNRGDYFLSGARDIFTRLQTSVFQMGKIRIRFHLAIDVLATCFLMALIVCGVVLVLQKKMAAGELIAVLQFGVLLMQATLAVALSNIQLQDAKLAFDRMCEFVAEDINDDCTGKDFSTNGVMKVEDLIFERLEVKQLSFRFAGRRVLLKEIAFSLEKGEIIAIVGESGQGKSTVFQLLQRFYKAEGGAILVNNTNILELDVFKWRKLIGVVTQSPVLISGTILENILLQKLTDNDVQAVVSFCQATGLHDYIIKLPQAYSTVVGEGGLTISGGQKQLICLARCLYHRPQLLLLDEPTSAMDKKMEAFVIELLQTLKSTCGTILISHKDSLTAIADRVYVLVNGTIHEQKAAVETVYLL